MIVYEFGVEDLARTRFTISPLFELTQSLRAMVEPERVAYHERWVDDIRGRLGGLDLIPAIKLIPNRGYVPDFIAPPPTTPFPEFHEELERVRKTPAAQVRKEVRLRFPQRIAPEVQPLVDHPRRELNRMCDTLAEYWERAIAPYWPRITAFLRADIQHRADRLTSGGAEALFADLDKTMMWTGSRLEIESKHDACVVLGGQGLLLMPTAFAPRQPLYLTDEAWDPTVVYPARAIGTLWEGGATSPKALATLLGATRAELLASLDAPRSTTELARRLDITAGGVSQHLSVLRESGLVSAERAGRSVLYVRTPLADRLARG